MKKPFAGLFIFAILVCLASAARADVSAGEWDDVMNNGILEPQAVIERKLGKPDEVIRDPGFGRTYYYDVYGSDSGVERGFVFYDNGKAGLLGAVFSSSISTRELIAALKPDMKKQGFTLVLDKKLKLHMKYTDKSIGFSIYLVVEEGEGGGYPVMYYMTQPVYTKMMQ